MEMTYDVFCKHSNGAKIWLKSVGSLLEAGHYLAQRTPCEGESEYYVCDLSARTVIAVMTLETGGLATLLDCTAHEESFFSADPDAAAGAA